MTDFWFVVASAYNVQVDSYFKWYDKPSTILISTSDSALFSWYKFLTWTMIVRVDRKKCKQKNFWLNASITVREAFMSKVLFFLCLFFFRLVLVYLEGRKLVDAHNRKTYRITYFSIKVCEKWIISDNVAFSIKIDGNFRSNRKLSINTDLQIFINRTKEKEKLWRCWKQNKRRQRMNEKKPSRWSKWKFISSIRKEEKQTTFHLFHLTCNEWIRRKNENPSTVKTAIHWHMSFIILNA